MQGGLLADGSNIPAEYAALGESIRALRWSGRTTLSKQQKEAVRTDELLDRYTKQYADVDPVKFGDEGTLMEAIAPGTNDQEDSDDAGDNDEGPVKPGKDFDLPHFREKEVRPCQV